MNILMKTAVCSSLLLSSTLAFAQTDLDLDLDVDTMADKRVITMTPVTSKGYMVYNLGLNLLLKKIDLSQIPTGPDSPDLSGLQDLLNSYEVANVVTPGKPSFNGPVKFDVTYTESGKGVGRYEFDQQYKNNTVTLRVIKTPLPGIPAAPELMEAMSVLGEMTE